MWLGIFHWDESTTGEWYSSSQWPLLPFHSGMLLHHNEWGDATAAGPGTSQARSQLCDLGCGVFLIFIIRYGTLFVCFNRGFTFDSRWIWCSFLALGWFWFSSKWPLLAFDSGILLHHNEWGDGTPAGPTTTRQPVRHGFKKLCDLGCGVFNFSLLFLLGPCLFVLI